MEQKTAPKETPSSCVGWALTADLHPSQHSPSLSWSAYSTPHPPPRNSPSPRSNPCSPFWTKRAS